MRPSFPPLDGRLTLAAVISLPSTRIYPICSAPSLLRPAQLRNPNSPSYSSPYL